MKRTQKLIWIIVIAVIMLTATPMRAFAMDANDIPPANEIGDDAFYAEASTGNSNAMTVMATGVGTLSGKCSIQKKSSTSVTCTGSSSITVSNSSLRIILTVQQYKNGAWNNYATAASTKSGTSVSLTKTFTVAKGYYYRLASTHLAVGVTNKYATTSSILVS